MKEKWKEFKSYVTSPPPHVLAKIEYRGHFLNIAGVLAVSILLFIKGYWYIVFAFIFSTLVSYSQGMSALARYKIFLTLIPEETYEYILQDKSFTRIRQRIFVKRYSRLVRWLMIVSCFIIIVIVDAYLYNGLQKITYSYTIKIAILTLTFYFSYAYLIISTILIHNKIKLMEGKNELEANSNKNINA